VDEEEKGNPKMGDQDKSRSYLGKRGPTTDISKHEVPIEARRKLTKLYEDI
jgi:hypothetical protein